MREAKPVCASLFPHSATTGGAVRASASITRPDQAAAARCPRGGHGYPHPGGVRAGRLRQVAVSADYVREYRMDYKAIFWVEAGQKESIERDFLQIYRQLFDRPLTVAQELLKMEDVVPAVKSWFHTQISRSLMVFDSADGIDKMIQQSRISISQSTYRTPRWWTSSSRRDVHRQLG